MIKSAHNFLEEAKKLSLTHEEREQGKAVLRLVMKKDELSLSRSEKSAVRQTLLTEMYGEKRGFFSSLVWGIKVPVVAFALVLLIGASGSGLAFAAESSLPGDALYPIKIHVNEALAGALKWTPDAQAEWAVDTLSRRIHEVEELNERGTIPEERQVELKKTVQDSILRVQQSSDALESERARVIRGKARGILRHMKVRDVLPITLPAALESEEGDEIPSSSSISTSSSASSLMPSSSKKGGHPALPLPLTLPILTPSSSSVTSSTHSSTMVSSAVSSRESSPSSSKSFERRASSSMSESARSASSTAVSSTSSTPIIPPLLPGASSSVSSAMSVSSVPIIPLLPSVIPQHHLQ